MRNVTPDMVDRSAWDQSFVDVEPARTVVVVANDEEPSSFSRRKEDDINGFASLVSPRTLLLWNGDPSAQPKSASKTQPPASVAAANGFLCVREPKATGRASNFEAGDNSITVAGDIDNGIMCGAVAPPCGTPTSDLSSDIRVYENTLDVDEWSTGTSVFFSQPSSPGLAAAISGETFGGAPNPPGVPRSALSSLETPADVGLGVDTVLTSKNHRVPSTSSSSTSGSISTSGVSSSHGSNCRTSTSPLRSSGQASDSGNGSDEERPLPFAPLPEGAPVRQMSSAADGDAADDGARWQRDATDARVFDGLAPSYSRVASFLPAWDLERLKTVYFRLAVCGFYYGRMTIDEAAERLCGRPVGTFLIRDSADSRFLFSVSVQTCRGPTSIRIAYRSGLFRLDCTPDQEHLLPTFDCAVRLLCHYVRLCGGNGYSHRKSRTANPSSTSGGVNSYVFLESSGRRDTPVLLRTPFRERPQRLGQLCRRTIHAAVGLGPVGVDADRESAVDRLPLVPSLKTYLKDYPYDL